MSCSLNDKLFDCPQLIGDRCALRDKTPIGKGWETIGMYETIPVDVVNMALPKKAPKRVRELSVGVCLSAHDGREDLLANRLRLCARKL